MEGRQNTIDSVDVTRGAISAKCMDLIKSAKEVATR